MTPTNTPETVERLQWPPSEEQLNEWLAQIVEKFWSVSTANYIRAGKLSVTDIKAKYALREILRPFAALSAPSPAGSGEAMREALTLARPIVESELSEAEQYADGDWEGMTRTALEAIDAALALAPKPDAATVPEGMKAGSPSWDESGGYVQPKPDETIPAGMKPSPDRTEGDDAGPCTCCADTGITIQTERACSCGMGDQYRPKPSPEKESCAFVECPPGLFRWQGLLCFKSEYSTKAGQQDAYCCDSGEYFWGGTSGDLAARRALIVTPVPSSTATTPSRLLEENEALRGEPYLVWSNEHKAWWGADHRGYTRHIDRAGRYDRAEALKIAGTRDGGLDAVHAESSRALSYIAALERVEGER